MNNGLIALFLIALGYFGILHLIFWGLKRLEIKNQTDFPTVSIVIAARNEAQRIEPALQALENLDYPENKLEIIFVDDASSDNTAQIIEGYCEKHANWHLLKLNHRSGFASGKKHALKHGINAAKHEIIFTTDADCEVPPGWLKYMTAYFEPNVQMVLGYSPLKRHSGIRNLLLQFDNLFSAIMAAAPTMWGYPISSVGRNMAYRKATYLKIGGFDALKKYRSGDDVYMTERFRLTRSGKITYCANPKTFVETLPPETFKDFWHQQIRKNSKTLRKSFWTTVFSLTAFLIYAYLWVYPLFFPAFWKVWAGIILLKLILEFVTLNLAANIFNRRWLKPLFPFFQLFYPLYITFFTLLGTFQIYQWKKS